MRAFAVVVVVLGVALMVGSLVMGLTAGSADVALGWMVPECVGAVAAIVGLGVWADS